MHRIPPLPEQKRIITKVTKLLSLCDALDSKLAQAESASTQLLSAAVHRLLQESSREGAKGTAISRKSLTAIAVSRLMELF